MAEDRFLVSDDRGLLDVDVIHGFLRTCYWSPGIPRKTVERAIEGSLCFGVYQRGAGGKLTQVGFARVISDYATFAYLCDVFILEPWRGHGLSRRLMEAILGHPSLQGLRRFTLMTRDAHGLYEKFGFKPRTDGGKAYLEVHNPGVYGATPGA